MKLNRPPRARAWSVRALSAALILVVAIGTPMLCRFASRPAIHSRRTGKLDGFWYFKSSQWRADGRTLVAAARWMMDQDQVVLRTTNPAPQAALVATNFIATNPIVPG